MTIDQLIEKGFSQELVYNPEAPLEGVLSYKEVFKEDDVVDKFKAFLEKEGCEILSSCSTKQKGIDIVAKAKCGVNLIVEAKGTQGKKDPRAAMGVAFQGAVGEVLQRGHLAELNTLNIIALPFNDYYLKKVASVNALQNFKIGLVFALIPVNGDPVYMYGGPKIN